MFHTLRSVAICVVIVHAAHDSRILAQDVTLADDQVEQGAFEQDNETDSASYFNETFGWTIAIPPDWELAESWDPGRIRFASVDGEASFGVCTVRGLDYLKKSLDEIADIWLEKQINDLAIPHNLLSRELVARPDGTNAMRVSHQLGGGLTGKSQTLIIATRSCVYLLIAEAKLDAWPAAEMGFSRFFESFMLPEEDSSAQMATEFELPDDAMFQDYLYSGKLTESTNALMAQIRANPEDDSLRFCLGIVQFGMAIEHLIQDLNRHGFLTERTFGTILRPELRQFFPDHESPSPFSNEVFRKIVQTWVADVTAAEATLAEIQQEEVKLHLLPGLIKIDPVGQGKAVNVAQLLRVMFPNELNDEIAKFGLTLDRGDVHWLRGYLHVHAALGECLLAHDFQAVIDSCAHQIFEQVDTPYRSLPEEIRKGKIVEWGNSEYPSDSGNYEVGAFWETNFPMESLQPPTTLYLDAAAFLVQILDLEIIEPQRLETVLNHLQQTVENAQQMWTYILAETDDDCEWIPNPNQQVKIGVAVSQPMVETWLATLSELRLILQGKKLVPFWRDLIQERPKDEVRGLNIRRVLESPPGQMAIVLWVQGTAAFPYLERGELTEFADEDFVRQINDAFGPSFPLFALWFN